MKNRKGVSKYVHLRVFISINTKNCSHSLFQALGQLGRSKRGRGTSGVRWKNRRAREGPSFFLYQTLLVARRPAAFDKPTDREPGTGYSQSVTGSTLEVTSTVTCTVVLLPGSLVWLRSSEVGSGPFRIVLESLKPKPNGFSAEVWIISLASVCGI